MVESLEKALGRLKRGLVGFKEGFKGPEVGKIYRLARGALGGRLSKDYDTGKHTLVSVVRILGLNSPGVVDLDRRDRKYEVTTRNLRGQKLNPGSEEEFDQTFFEEKDLEKVR